MPAPKTRTDEAMLMKTACSKKWQAHWHDRPSTAWAQYKDDDPLSCRVKLAQPFTASGPADGVALWGRVIRERKILAKNNRVSGCQPCEKNALRAWLQSTHSF
jgi:hypothetical protein